MTRYSPAEKREIIRLVETSELPVTRTLQELDVPRSTFYGWYRRYREAGDAGLAPNPSRRQQFWNRIPDQVRERVVEIALEDHLPKRHRHLLPSNKEALRQGAAFARDELAVSPTLADGAENS